jgi:hypothetical protein
MLRPITGSYAQGIMGQVLAHKLQTITVTQASLEVIGDPISITLPEPSQSENTWSG